jgi:hypothetical protein
VCTIKHQGDPYAGFIASTPMQRHMLCMWKDVSRPHTCMLSAVHLSAMPMQMHIPNQTVVTNHPNAAHSRPTVTLAVYNCHNCCCQQQQQLLHPPHHPQPNDSVSHFLAAHTVQVLTAYIQPYPAPALCHAVPRCLLSGAMLAPPASRTALPQPLSPQPLPKKTPNPATALPLPLPTDSCVCICKKSSCYLTPQQQQPTHAVPSKRGLQVQMQRCCASVPH